MWRRPMQEGGGRGRRRGGSGKGGREYERIEGGPSTITLDRLAILAFLLHTHHVTPAIHPAATIAAMTAPTMSPTRLGEVREEEVDEVEGEVMVVGDGRATAGMPTTIVADACGLEVVCRRQRAARLATAGVATAHLPPLQIRKKDSITQSSPDSSID
ncbi:hypothetical protein BJY59DRAFT_491141 [Rhodotorula toruloides]